MIPYGRQSIDESDIEAVVATLRSAWLTQGPAIPAFESAFAERCQARHGIAVCNATAALHIACLALGVGPGDRVWTSPISFVASANCALYCGAEIDFVDVDAQTQNLSPDALEEKLVAAAKTGTLPKVVIPVHFSGRSCDMARIAQMGQQYGFKIIEDASHAVGASYGDAPVGSCIHSDITIFSFHPVKIITTAEGGMALTNNPELAERMLRLRTHGITKDLNRMRGQSDGPWYYEQIDLGYNYRLTDLQAALGLSQLQRLDAFIARRRMLAAHYAEALATTPCECPPPSSDSAWHLYPIRVAPDQRRATFEALHTAGIGVQVHYIPIHRQPYFERLGFASGDFPVAEHYYQQAISLPLYPDLPCDEVVRISTTLRDILLGE